MHTLITQHEAQKRGLLRRVYMLPGWHMYNTRTKMPPMNFMPTVSFSAVHSGKSVMNDLDTGKRVFHKLQGKQHVKELDLLVLDNYGMYDYEGVFPEAFQDALFGRCADDTDTVLAINRVTGQCYLANYGVENKELILVLTPDLANGASSEALRLPKVPKQYLSRLDELRSKKRPFGFKLGSRTLLSYIERWSSLENLADDFVILLDFDNYHMVELHGDHYRVVSEWKDNGWPRNEED